MEAACAVDVDMGGLSAVKTRHGGAVWAAGQERAEWQFSGGC